MALVMLEGFKYLPNTSSRYSALNASSGTSTWSRQTNRSGGYALRYSNSLTNDSSAVVGRIKIGITASFSLGFAANHATTFTGAPNYLVTGIVIAAASDAYTHGFTIASGSPVGAQLTSSGVSATTILDTTNTTLGWHWWNLVGVMNVTTGGSVNLYRDGVQVATASPDTLSTSGDAAFVSIYMGNANGAAFSGIDVCDLVLRNDTNLIPDTRVDVLAPTSDSAAGWTRSTGSTNYTLVDDTGPTVDTSDYVTSSTAATTDTYGMADLGHNPTSIYAVGVHALSRKDTGGVRSAAVMVNSTEATPQDTGSNGTVYGYWETNPSGGAAWTKANVDAMTAGIRIKT